MSQPSYDQQIAQLAAINGGGNGEINQELVDHVISLSKRTTSQANLDFSLVDQISAFKRQKVDCSDDFNKNSSADVDTGKTEKKADDNDNLDELDSDCGEDNTHEAEDRRQRRLMQNRKSARKCRMKKKDEYNVMKEEVTSLRRENKGLKDKVNEITVMLYSKIQENTLLQRKVELLQSQPQQMPMQSLQMLQLQQAAVIQQQSMNAQANFSATKLMQGLQMPSTQSKSQMVSTPPTGAMDALKQGLQMRAGAQPQGANLIGVIQNFLKTTQTPVSRSRTESGESLENCLKTQSQSSGRVSLSGSGKTITMPKPIQQSTEKLSIQASPTLSAQGSAPLM